MNIGLTYDLKDDAVAAGLSPLDAAEFDRPETIEAITTALERAGHAVDAIGSLDALVRRLAAGHAWDLVFNIAEGFRGAARESQVPALLEARGIPCTFADSLSLAVSLHKGYSKDIVRARGVPTARHIVVEDAAFDFASVDLAYPLFAKPVAEGTGKGVTPAGKAANPDELRAACLRLLERFSQPVIVEEFLPGREFTVGIVGTGARARVLGVMEVLLLPGADAEIYSFDNKDNYEERVRYRLAPPGDEAGAAASAALAGYRALGCRDAGRVDVRSDARGVPHFLEANPLAGLHPKHSDLPILCRLLGIGYDHLIQEILSSAMERMR